MLQKVDGKMKKIMLVDDETDQILTLKYGFKHDNEYEFIGANSGEHCFELLKDGQIPDVILLDLMMPGMSGWTVHDRLKKKDSPYNDIPIIFLTGARFGEDYIEKPYELADLKKRIEAILNKD